MEHFDFQGLAGIISTGANLIYINTATEKRTERIVMKAAQQLKEMGIPYIWTCTTGFSRDGNPVPNTVDPLRALDFALTEQGASVFLFKDLPWFWRDNPYIIRKLKDFAARAIQKAIVLIGQDEKVPETLREDMIIFHQGLPVIGEITAHLEHLRNEEPLLAAACETDPELLGRLAVAAQGLDLADLDHGVRALRLTGNANGEAIIQAILRTKQRFIRESGIMTTI